jgi:hypothetical protein
MHLMDYLDSRQIFIIFILVRMEISIITICVDVWMSFLELRPIVVGMSYHAWGLFSTDHLLSKIVIAPDVTPLRSINLRLLWRRLMLHQLSFNRCTIIVIVQGVAIESSRNKRRKR